MTANQTNVGSQDRYLPGRGYGFVTEGSRRDHELLRIPELNSGLEPASRYEDRELTCLQEDEDGCMMDSDGIAEALEREEGAEGAGSPGRIPLIFKMDLPRQGNYLVTLTLRSREELGEVLIFAGRRRLAYRGHVGAGEFTCQMTVNVCDIVPAGHSRIFPDTSLDIAILAGKPRITALTVEARACPTIYLAGDSTVTDQPGAYPYAPGRCYGGWGQMLPAYLNTGVAVSNHAHSGLTTDSFRREGHYAVIDQYSRPGDYIFFQFGHNDQKLQELQARGGYRTNLIRYITETRDKDVLPVLVTPIARNTWRLRDGAYLDLLEEFADVCLDLGETYDLPVLDLHGRSMEYIRQKGLEGARPIFFPGDYTHTNDFGAYQMAGYVAEEIVKKCGSHEERGYRYLAECVSEGFGPWEGRREREAPQKPERDRAAGERPDTVLAAEADQLERLVRLCLKEELL